MVEFFIALRHIKTRKFQSIACITGVALSLIVFICSISISNGLKDNTINSILNISPHISFEYNGDYNTIVEKINSLNIKNIKKVYKSTNFSGFAKANDNKFLPYINAMDLDDFDSKIIKTNENINKGSIFVGSRLAQNYLINLDDNIDIISLSGKQIKLKVDRIIETGLSAIDSNILVIPFEIANILNENTEDSYKINIKIDDPSNLKLLNNIQNQINEELGVYSISWTQENQNLLSAIKFEEFILIVILSLLFLISSFIIFIIQNMSVREKTQDIGILKTFNYSNRQILNIFLLEGLILGIIGIIIAQIISPIVLNILVTIFKNTMARTYNISNLVVAINIHEIIFISSFALFMILIASVIPAIKASKIDPIKSLKFNL